MAEQDMSIAKLSEEFEYFKRQYDEMEAAYQLQLKQMSVNPAISQAKRDLQDTREACVAMSNQRDALLDRILDLERAARLHKDPCITTRRGTPRESRLRARLLPSLNEPIKPDFDPYATSRHCGPDAVHARNQRLAQQQAAALHYEQSLLQKADPERSIVKLPKRARANKAGSSGRGAAAAATGAATGPASSSSSQPTTTTTNIHVFPIDSFPSTSSSSYPPLATESDVLPAISSQANGNTHPSHSASGTNDSRGSNDGRYD